MARNDRLVFGLLTPESLEEHSVAVKYLSVLFSRMPAFAPDLYGHFEPVRHPFSSLEECLSDWAMPFLWRRRRPRVEGAIWPSTDLSTIYVSGSGDGWESALLESLARSLAEALPLDLAYFHLMTDKERDSEPYDHWYPIDTGVTPHDLRKGIPNLCWLMVFGPSYAARIRAVADRVSSGVSVEELGHGRLALRLTKNLDDVRDYAGFRLVRQAAKDALDLDGSLFFPRS